MDVACSNTCIKSIVVASIDRENIFVDQTEWLNFVSCDEVKN